MRKALIAMSEVGFGLTGAAVLAYILYATGISCRAWIVERRSMRELSLHSFFVSVYR